MEKHFTYPLTLTLLSLCHIDGKMSKTTMSTLMKELESVVNIPEMVDVVIAEEMFFLQLLPDLPETFQFRTSYNEKTVFFFFCQKELIMYWIR